MKPSHAYQNTSRAKSATVLKPYSHPKLGLATVHLPTRRRQSPTATRCDTVVNAYVTSVYIGGKGYR
jgi:hypothetical protein